MSKRWALSIVVVILATGCSVAWAGEPRTHDRFFLRLSAGGGGATTSIEDATGKIEFSGGVGDANFAIGGVVAPNLAIHGTFWGWSMSDPDAELTISGVGTDSGTLNGTVSMSAVGGGLTYYFMPVNLYLSGSVGIGSLHLDSDLSEKDTDSGSRWTSLSARNGGSGTPGASGWREASRTTRSTIPRSARSGRGRATS